MNLAKDPSIVSDEDNILDSDVCDSRVPGRNHSVLQSLITLP